MSETESRIKQIYLIRKINKIKLISLASTECYVKYYTTVENSSLNKKKKYFLIIFINS